VKVLQFVTRLDLGGAQEACLDQCRLLLGRGHEVHLLTGSRGELLEEARNIPNLRLHTWEDWHHEVRPVEDLRCLLRLVRWLRAGGFDLLHTHSSKAGFFGRLAAWLAGSPPRVLHHVHGWSFNATQPPLVRAFFAALERLAARPGFLLLACSEATARAGREARVCRPQDLRVLPYGIGREGFLRLRPRPAIRRRLGLAQRDLLFLQLSNLKPQKDPITFATAAVAAGRLLPRAHFWIAGDGPLRKRAEEIASRGGLGDRFRVLGWRRDVPELLAAADVVALTSRFEGLPLAVVRAMAAGVPVVATAVDGTAEAVLDGRTGLLVPPGNAEAAAAAFVRLGRDALLRRRMGRAARQRSEAFDRHPYEARLLSLYESAPGAVRPPGYH
jgi:glycosyltransferase involved in cell wall biosynthesis